MNNKNGNIKIKYRIIIDKTELYQSPFFNKITALIESFDRMKSVEYIIVAMAH